MKPNTPREFYLARNIIGQMVAIEGLMPGHINLIETSALDALTRKVEELESVISEAAKDRRVTYAEFVLMHTAINPSDSEIAGERE